MFSVWQSNERLLETVHETQQANAALRESEGILEQEGVSTVCAESGSAGLRLLDPAGPDPAPCRTDLDRCGIFA